MQFRYLSKSKKNLKTLLHCSIFSATCLAMPFGTKNEKCSPSPLLKLPQNCEKRCWRGDTLCNGVASCCNPLWKVEPSSTSKKIAQQKNCKTTHVTLCNSPATCLATALRDKLPRKLRSVTGPLQSLKLQSLQAVAMQHPFSCSSNDRKGVHSLFAARKIATCASTSTCQRNLKT